MGPHRESLLEMARAIGANTFVETGTYKGKTTRWAAANFDSVHTVERAKPFYDRYHQELEQLGNITTHFGDSRDALPSILNQLNGSPAVYWLDSHWMGGVTAGEDDECPLMDELAVLCSHTNNIIMIDDARYFLCAPPRFHDAKHWPTMFDIASMYKDVFNDVFVQIFHDIIFIVPNRERIVEVLIQHACDHADSLLKQT
ncbi:MAG: class I SAM-dependent methyltransferase [Acidiferrobacterales bacterium]|nr:class I SAM-dependent methyltransferase [Acidiferrobacterales bacterium]